MLPPLFEYFAEVKVHGGNYLEKTYTYMYVCTHLPFVSIWSLCSVKKYDLCVPSAEWSLPLWKHLPTPLICNAVLRLMFTACPHSLVCIMIGICIGHVHVELMLESRIVLCAWLLGAPDMSYMYNMLWLTLS